MAAVSLKLIGSQRKFVSVMKVGSYLLMVNCDDRLKHDRLLTLIRLFGYRNTGTRVVLVHDNKHIIYYIQGATPHSCNVSNNLHDSHIIQFKHA